MLHAFAVVLIALGDLGVGDDTFDQPAHTVRAVLAAFDALQTFEVRLGQRRAGRDNLVALIVLDGAAKES